MAEAFNMLRKLHHQGYEINSNTNDGIISFQELKSVYRYLDEGKEINSTSIVPWELPGYYYYFIPVFIVIAQWIVLYFLHFYHLKDFTFQSLYIRIAFLLPVMISIALCALYYPWIGLWITFVGALLEGYIIICFFALLTGLGWRHTNVLHELYHSEYRLRILCSGACESSNCACCVSSNFCKNKSSSNSSDASATSSKNPTGGADSESKSNASERKKKDGEKSVHKHIHKRRERFQSIHHMYKHIVLLVVQFGFFRPATSLIVAIYSQVTQNIASEEEGDGNDVNVKKAKVISLTMNVIAIISLITCLLAFLFVLRTVRTTLMKHKNYHLYSKFLVVKLIFFSVGLNTIILSPLATAGYLPIPDFLCSKDILKMSKQNRAYCTERVLQFGFIIEIFIISLPLTIFYSYKDFEDEEYEGPTGVYKFLEFTKRCWMLFDLSKHWTIPDEYKNYDPNESTIELGTSSNGEKDIQQQTQQQSTQNNGDKGGSSSNSNNNNANQHNFDSSESKKDVESDRKIEQSNVAEENQDEDTNSKKELAQHGSSKNEYEQIALV